MSPGSWRHEKNASQIATSPFSDVDSTKEANGQDDNERLAESLDKDNCDSEPEFDPECLDPELKEVHGEYVLIY